MLKLLGASLIGIVLTVFTLWVLVGGGSEDLLRQAVGPDKRHKHNESHRTIFGASFPFKIQQRASNVKNFGDIKGSKMLFAEILRVF